MGLVLELEEVVENGARLVETELVDAPAKERASQLTSVRPRCEASLLCERDVHVDRLETSDWVGPNNGVDRTEGVARVLWSSARKSAKGEAVLARLLPKSLGVVRRSEAFEESGKGGCETLVGVVATVPQGIAARLGNRVHLQNRAGEAKWLGIATTPAQTTH